MNFLMSLLCTVQVYKYSNLFFFKKFQNANLLSVNISIVPYLDLNVFVDVNEII